MIIHKDSGLKGCQLFPALASRLSSNILFVFILSSINIGCQPDLEQPYEIKKLRILGVKADSPQIKVNLNGNIPSFYPEKVNFEILAADPESVCKEERFKKRLSVCIPQQYTDDSSYDIDCEGENEISISGFSLEPIKFFMELMYRYKDIGHVNMPIEFVLKDNRFKLPLPVMARVSNDKEEVIAIKFVEFISYEIDNRNPKITSVLVDNIDVTSKGYHFALISNREYKITPIVDKKTIDKVYYEGIDRYEDEGIQFSFFAQKGEFDKVATSDKSPDVLYKTPNLEAEEYTSIYIVARDFRGGIDWVIMNCIRILPDIEE
ncbi:MAG: hypothetical protein N2746_02370 [Deltaproteobacteria bacterium]|nr:hypothetical protein [Deltaproteobacteria bacterium]